MAILRLLTSLGVVMLFGLALPQRISDARSRASTVECLTMPDGPVEGSASEVARYEGCLDMDPSNESLVTALGGIYEQSGDVVRAETVYRRALAVDPGYAQARVRLGWLLLRRGDARGARAAADEALRTLLNDRSALALRQQAIGVARP